MNSKKLNLLIIGSSMGCFGGMEAFMITLTEAALDWPEYDVKLCFKLVKNVEPQNDLIHSVKHLSEKVYFVQSSSLELFKLITWSNILHVQNTPPDVIFSARILTKKVFLTVHNWRRPATNIHTLLWRLSVKLAHRRWFNSRFVWDTWETRNKSTNSDSFPTVSKLPTTWCPPTERRGFIFIGRWIPNKGIEEILMAYAKNTFNTQEWPLTILGDGPLKPIIIKMIKELDLKNINMPGFVDASSKEKYLASARWLLAPAKTKEDLGLTPIEARSVGVPSIVTRDGGLPEAAGAAALISEPGNVEDLARCMNEAAKMDESEYARRGSFAQKSLEDYLKPIEFYRSAYLN